MRISSINNPDEVKWFAIKTQQDFRAEKMLRPYCEEVFFPKETIKHMGKRPRQRAIIPHVLFIKTTYDNALTLEKMGQKLSGISVPFWIYRYPSDNKIQVISQNNINLLKLLSADDASKCEIYNNEKFNVLDYVRVTGGIFKEYEGYVSRVKKNLHVLVKIEGICVVMLPFIHPDLLERIS